MSLELHLSRLYLIEFERPPTSDLDRYDPSEALRAEFEASKGEEQRRDLAERLDRAYEEDVRRARTDPLPPIIAAFRDVFGQLPDGWLHPDM